MKFLKKNWGNILILALIIVLIVPQTRKPIQIFVNRLLSFSPNVIEEENQLVKDYHWTLRTLLGEDVNFSASKGNIVLVNFWATWCAPCIAEMPDFQNLYEKYGQQIDFYFVSSDDKMNIKNFMNENHYSFPVFTPLREAPRILMGQTLPSTFLIDKNGKIVIKEYGTADWNGETMHRILDRLLNEKNTARDNSNGSDTSRI